MGSVSDVIYDFQVAKVEDLDHKEPVATSTEGLGNITLSGEQTLNGVTTSLSRVMVMEQTAGEDNGIYDTGPGAWTRSEDADNNAKVTNGLTVWVDGSASTVLGNQYLLTTPNPIVLETTSLTFSTIPSLGVHAIGGANHTASTLAQFNTKISDVDLDPTSITDAAGVTAVQTEFIAAEKIIRFKIDGENDKYNIGCPLTDTGINSLIDSLGITGGMGLLPEGTYTMTGSAVIDQDNTVLRGTGWGTILDGFAFSGALFYINISGGHDQCVISDMKFLGNDGVGDTEKFINATGCDHLRIYDNLFVDSDFDSVALNSPCNEFRIMNNFSLNADTVGFRFATSGDGLFLGNTMSTDTTGADFDSGCVNDIIAFNFSLTCVTGLDLGCDKSVIMGNFGASNTTGITTALIQDSVLIGNKQVSPSGTAFNVSGGNNNVFVGNSVNLGAQRGFHFLSGTTNNVIMGNMVNRAGNGFDDFVIDASDKNVFIGNVGLDVAGKGERGLLLNDADSNLVMGQHFSAHDTAGIALTGTSDNNIIMFNHLDGELVARITDTTGNSNNIIWDADTLNMIVTTNTDLGVASGKFVGLAFDKGRIVFVDDTIDTISFTDADVNMSLKLTVTGIATLGDGSLLASDAAPTTDPMIANKKYVDDNAGGAYSNSGEAGTADRTLGNTDNFGLAFLTNNLERITILNSGSVGIGTATPLAKLAINGGVHVGGDSDPGDNNLLVDGNVTVSLVIGGTSTTADLSFKTTSGVGIASADMHFLVGNDGATEAMTILNNGRVGMGTIAPNAGLDVRVTPGPVVGGFASGGFHVTSPSALVNANAVITGHNLNGGNKQLWYLGSTSSSNDDIAFINRQVGSLAFLTSNATRMTILAASNTLQGNAGLKIEGGAGVHTLTLSGGASSGSSISIGLISEKIGFFERSPVVKPTGVGVTTSQIHAALVSLGLIAA